MKHTDFVALCLEQTIDPYLALENEALKAALRAGDDEEAKRILKEEF